MIFQLISQLAALINSMEAAIAFLRSPDKVKGAKPFNLSPH
jgi:hypothetical protein